jgi:tetratricopeptide (TPR) repeat protein
VEKLLKNAYLLHPDNEQFCRLIANFYRNHDNINEAISYYEKLDEIAPESIDTIQTILTIYLQEQRDDDLNKYLSKIENRKILQKSESIKLIGYLFFYYRKFDLSLQFFNKLPENDKKDINIISTLAQLYNQKGEYEKAEKLFLDIKKDIKDPDESKKYFLLLGQNYYEQKNYQKAENIFKEGLENFPDDFDLYYSLISVLGESKKYDEINKVISTMEKKIKDKVEANELKALALTTQKKYQEAIAIYEKLLTDSPENEHYYYSLAII